MEQTFDVTIKPLEKRRTQDFKVHIKQVAVRELKQLQVPGLYMVVTYACTRVHPLLLCL